MQVIIRINDNCKIVKTNEKEYVLSYDTIVAEINHAEQTIYLITWSVNNGNGKVISHSATTTRHINAVSKYFNYKIK
jgi:hypothetical protein